MTSYEVMTVIEKAKSTVGDVTYYEKDQLELFLRFVNSMVNELLAVKPEDKPVNASE